VLFLGLLLFSSCAQSYVLPEKRCGSMSSSSDCINYINSALTDGTKCIPMVVELTGRHECISWNDYEDEDKPHPIDFAGNWEGVSETQKT